MRELKSRSVFVLILTVSWALQAPAALTPSTQNSGGGLCGMILPPSSMGMDLADENSWAFSSHSTDRFFRDWENSHPQRLQLLKAALEVTDGQAQAKVQYSVNLMTERNGGIPLSPEKEANLQQLRAVYEFMNYPDRLFYMDIAKAFRDGLQDQYQEGGSFRARLERAALRILLLQKGLAILDLLNRQQMTDPDVDHYHQQMAKWGFDKGVALAMLNDSLFQLNYNWGGQVFVTQP